MTYAVTCMVGLLVYTSPTKINHMNIELHGTEVKEINMDKSLVDFTDDIKRHGIKVVGDTAVYINMNNCLYDKRPDTGN